MIAPAAAISRSLNAITRVPKASPTLLCKSSISIGVSKEPLQVRIQSKRILLFCTENSPLWRREWDSNPRYGFPYTRFPSERLQPLGHPSAQTQGLRRAHYSHGAPTYNVIRTIGGGAKEPQLTCHGPPIPGLPGSDR